MNKATMLIAVLAGALAIPVALAAQPSMDPGREEDLLARLRAQIDAGEIVYKLTDSDEIEALLGTPEKEETRRSGGMQMLSLSYPDIEIELGKMRHEKDSPFTIRTLHFQGEKIDIGQGRRLTLKNRNDLRKLDRFGGLQNVSLKNLDLRDEAKILNTMIFDSLTEWPPGDKLPAGFNPDQLMEQGKTPGLGVRGLHEKGIDGRGVGIAIIDQPLLLGHQEYTSRLVRYDATGLADLDPQMHSAPIVSITAGKLVGVAPGATVTHFAVPMWKKENAYYIRSLEKIFALSSELPEDERIRVVSISTSPLWHHPDDVIWRNAVKRAAAMGILIVTCDSEFLRFGTLTLIEGRDPDRPESYRTGYYSAEDNVLRVPTGNKTVASHLGNDVYKYEREGGRSWAAPYLAGLAALAFQLEKDISPQTIVELLIATATPTEAGPVVNPRGFIDRVLMTGTGPAINVRR